MMDTKDKAEPAEEGIFRMPMTATSVNVDRYGRMRLSALLYAAQILSLRCMEEERILPEGKAEDAGITPVVAGKVIEIERFPLYGEEPLIEVWQGAPEHYAQIYHSALKDQEGNVIARGLSVWMLIDKTSRAAVLPGDFGMQIIPVKREGELTIPAGVPAFWPQEEVHRKIFYSELDMNGHVSNARYADWLDDLFPSSFHRDHQWSRFQISYQHEVPPESEILLSYRAEQQEVLCEGTEEGKNLPLFRIAARYR